MVAVAYDDNPNFNNITTIDVIANQIVNECNRIETKATQLAKFGVKTTELLDDIKVHNLIDVSESTGLDWLLYIRWSLCCYVFLFIWINGILSTSFDD